MKFTYLWMKTIMQREESDEIGVDFWVFGRAQENFDYMKSLKQSYILIDIDIEKSPMEMLKELEVFSKDASANQLNKRTEQFNYKNMIHFIADEYGTKSSGEAPILDSIFPMYSQLSFFVHGGPESISQGIITESNVVEFAEHATFLALYTKLSAFTLCYQTERKFEPLCLITRDYVDKFASA